MHQGTIGMVNFLEAPETNVLYKLFVVGMINKFPFVSAGQEEECFVQ